MRPPADSNPWIALLTLTAMEIVLGVDNVVFIAILVGRVSADKRERIRRIGIALALVIRIGLLFTLSWLMGLTAPLFAVLGNEISGRDRHPTVKILALAFLLLIGVMLVAEGFGQHISKGYIYFAMAFALLVELLNMRLRKVHKPVHLHAGERGASRSAENADDRAKT